MKTVMIRRGDKINKNVPSQYLVDQIKKGALKNSDEISTEGTKWIRLDQYPQLAKYFKIQPISNPQISDSESAESKKHLLPDGQIKCPKCGFIQPNADKCNSCDIYYEKYLSSLKKQEKKKDDFGGSKNNSGEKSDNLKKSGTGEAIMGFIVLVALLYIPYCMYKGLQTNKCEDDVMAYVMSEYFVKKRLKSPSTADFPWGSNGRVRRLGNCSYEVTSYVDSKNSFGATVRTNYVVKLKPDQNDEWVLISIDMR